MEKKIFERSNYKLTAVVGGILILLVVSIGISFFNALYESQLSTRKEFLNKQTELAARGIEFELIRFQEETRTFLNYLENTDWDQNKVRQDLPLAARRTFIAFPSIIDTIWVDLGDSVMRYTITSRNDFIQSTVQGIPDSKAGKYQVIEGNSGLKTVYSYDLLGFAREYVSNFYQTPGGSKYLLFNNQLFDIGAASSVTERKIQDSDLQRIREDISLGLKGFYQINWNEGGEADIEGLGSVSFSVWIWGYSCFFGFFCSGSEPHFRSLQYLLLPVYWNSFFVGWIDFVFCHFDKKQSGDL